ncbi:hypothetical protein HQ584_11490 [Patescibacteria group bacterium]|nr:hypothetical protein [Patescibacteria group bacterium]
MIVQGNLYKDFHKQFIGKGIQACISFGLLEHFTRSDLKKVIRKQFLIAPLLICIVPIKTPATLKTFEAENKPEGNIDKYGIYRNFWTLDFWEKEIFKEHHVIDKDFRQNQEPKGLIDTLTLAVRKEK